MIRAEVPGAVTPAAPEPTATRVAEGRARHARSLSSWTSPAQAAVVLGVWMAGALVFFRDQVGSGFDKLMGNDGDARLVVYICEHWFGVLHGRESWLSPQFFHPVKGLLGWSDTFLLYQVFYAPLREVGCDPFLALQLTLILLSLLGFASFVCLARIAFGASMFVALAGAVVFTFSNAMFLHAGSPQFSGIFFVPLALLLGILSWRSRTDRPARAAVLGVACGLLVALMLYSTYYVAWFSVLAGGAALLAVLVLVVASGRAPQIARAVTGSVNPLVSAGAGFVIGIVPFLVTYLPSRSHHLSYAQTMGYADRLRDVVNVGAGNLVWGRVIHHFAPSMSGASEVSYAVTPILMLVVVTGGALGGWLFATRRAERASNALAAPVLAVTALVLCALPLRTRFGSPWAIVWNIPGASPIRAIGRLELVTNLVACLALVAAATELAARLRVLRLGSKGRPNALRAAGVAVLGLVILEQVNTTDVSLINRPHQLALLRSATYPEFICRSFYVTDPGQPGMPFFEYQIDAMLISQRLGIPTLNGYTGYNPAGWDLENPGDAAYPLYVQSWVAAKGTQDSVCGLDLGTMRWTQGLPSAGSPR